MCTSATGGYRQVVRDAAAGACDRAGAAARRCRGARTCGTAVCGPASPRQPRRPPRTWRTDLSRIHLYRTLLIKNYTSFKESDTAYKSEYRKLKTVYVFKKVLLKRQIK